MDEKLYQLNNELKKSNDKVEMMRMEDVDIESIKQSSVLDVSKAALIFEMCDLVRKFYGMDREHLEYYDFLDEINSVWDKINSEDPLFCSFNEYLGAYDLNKQLYLSEYIDASEVEFIELEVSNLKVVEQVSYKSLYLDFDVYPFILKRDQYAMSAKRKIEFLKLKLEVVIAGRNSIIKDQLSNVVIEEDIDYSESEKLERMVMLHEIGVLEYLQGKLPDNFNEAKLGSLISSFTGITSQNARRYLNSIKNVKNKNNPLKIDNVNKVRARLTEMGLIDIFGRKQ